MNSVILMSSLAVSAATNVQPEVKPSVAAVLSNGIYQYVAGSQLRLTEHENAHRLAILKQGGVAWFDTGDTDPRKYAANHSLLKPGTTFFSPKAFTEREAFTFASSGLNAETRFAEQFSSANPFVTLPARLSALFYATRGKFDDFSQMGVDQRKAAALQTVALVASCGGPQVYVYFNPEGMSLKATQTLGRKKYWTSNLAFESTGSRSEASLSHTFTFDGGLSVTPKVITNLHSAGVACSLNYKAISLEAASHNPRTLSGFRDSYGASQCTAEASLTIQQRF